MHLIWPPSGPAPLTDAALLQLYLPADRTCPTLRINLVTSLDGAVAVDGRSAGLSGSADKRVFGVLRACCDALLVGAGTARTEEYGAFELGERRRSLRRDLGLAGHPPMVIVSRSLALDPGHPLFTAAPVRPIVVTCAASPPQRRTALAPVADVIVAGDETVDLAAAIGHLRERGLRQVLCEGGPQVFGSLTAENLVDEVCLTVSPLLVGGTPGRLSVGPPLEVPGRLTLRHVLTAEGVLLLRYTR